MSYKMASQSWQTARWRVLDAMRASARCKQRTVAAVVGSPDLESLTTSHIERAFLTTRQELKRFGRKTLGYSKSVKMHKHPVAVHFGVYNFVRKHHTLGTTPAVATGLEEKPWSLEQVVQMTASYIERSI
jgi:CMP-2-keto-3-deoxyoctulosonic acid synthetase